MALLLNIDTATAYASVGISRDGRILGSLANDAQKDHASFLQPAIAGLSADLGISLSSLDAIALTIGPGSYTGLRVGLSSAKGLAYVLDRPLIPVVTLEVMAHAAREAWALEASPDGAPGTGADGPPLFCPMIDARRDEVFTAIYNGEGKPVLEPTAIILAPEVFEPYTKNNYLIFSGDGSLKWKSKFSTNKARFLLIQHSVADLAPIAETRYQAGTAASLAYLEPLYLKEFHKNG
jgi:tRNA threonylcarbamoyladenosine biosynthesis protein TsaB